MGHPFLDTVIASFIHYSCAGSHINNWYRLLIPFAERRTQIIDISDCLPGYCIYLAIRRGFLLSRMTTDY